MNLKPEEESAINELNDKFFCKLNRRLVKDKYPRLNPKYKDLVIKEFIADILPLSYDNPESMKNAMEEIVHHKVSNILKAFVYYAQACYNFYLYFGWSLFYFLNNPSMHPRVERRGSGNFVTAPSAKSDSRTSLYQFFKECKDGSDIWGIDKKNIFRSISGWDFLEENILNKFNLKVGRGYKLPLEHLYFSFYMAWMGWMPKDEDEKTPFDTSTVKPFCILETGRNFLEHIMTKDLNNMFVRFKETKYYNERMTEYDDGRRTQYFVLGKNQNENDKKAPSPDKLLDKLLKLIDRIPLTGLSSLIKKVRGLYLKKCKKDFTPKKEDEPKIPPTIGERRVFVGGSYSIYRGKINERDPNENSSENKKPSSSKVRVRNVSLNSPARDSGDHVRSLSDIIWDNSGPEYEVIERDDPNLLLFFKVAFMRDNTYLTEIESYQTNNDRLRNDLYNYGYKPVEAKSELKDLYKKSHTGIKFDSTRFNEKIRKEILNPYFTEFLIRCGRKKIIDIYAGWFSKENGERQAFLKQLILDDKNLNGVSFDYYDRKFLEYIEGLVKKSFNKFEEEMKKFSKSTTDTGCESDLRDTYNDILKRNLSDPKKPLPDNVPPRIDAVKLRKSIDKIAEASLGALRKEYLMAWPCNRGGNYWEGRNWRRTFYGEYCNGNQALLNCETFREWFYNMDLRKVTGAIVSD